jgi:hypothetical protein
MFNKKIVPTLVALFGIFAGVHRAEAQYAPITYNVGYISSSTPVLECVPNADKGGYPGAECITVSNTSGPLGAFSTTEVFQWHPSPKQTVSQQVTFTGVYAVQGYINPKYMVVGVTYAPPGPSANTSVNYQESNLVGTTTSMSSMFKTSVSQSVSIGAGYAVAVSKGTVTATYSTTTSQSNKTTNTVTTSIQVQDGEKTAGTSNYFAPVNHDYDIIWVWLNAAAIFNAGGNYLQWNGWGYDTTDQPSPDIIPIQLGYLNGDFGAIPADIQDSINRAWAADQKFGPGEGPALTSTDLAAVAAADPFSVSTYGSDYIGYTPPSTETADHRFTLSACSSTSSIDYFQAAPSTTAPIDTCTLTYTNTSTAADDITHTSSQTFSIDASVSASFVATISADVKTSYTAELTTEKQSSITETTTSTAALSVQGAPCNNTVSGVGPCVPVYDASGTEPTQFEVYQDNMYGTFLFAPIHFY